MRQLGKYLIKKRAALFVLFAALALMALGVGAGLAYAWFVSSAQDVSAVIVTGSVKGDFEFSYDGGSLLMGDYARIADTNKVVGTGESPFVYRITYTGVSETLDFDADAGLTLDEDSVKALDLAQAKQADDSRTAIDIDKYICPYLYENGENLVDGAWVKDGEPALYPDRFVFEGGWQSDANCWIFDDPGSGTSGAELTVAFEGEAITVIGRRDPQGGKVDFILDKDGKQPRSVTVNTFAAEYENGAELFKINGLGVDEPHTLTISRKGYAGALYLDRFSVTLPKDSQREFSVTYYGLYDGTEDSVDLGPLYAKFVGGGQTLSASVKAQADFCQATKNAVIDYFSEDKDTLKAMKWFELLPEN